MRKIGYSNEIGTNARIFETEFQAVENTTEIPKWKVWQIPDRNNDLIFDTNEYLGNLIHRLNTPFGIDYDYWYLWTPNNGDILRTSFDLDTYRNSIN